MSEKLITNSTQAKELLLGAATALEGGVDSWCASDVAKIRYLAERIEEDLDANEAFEEQSEAFKETLLTANDMKNENRDLHRKMLLFLQSPLYVNGHLGTIAFKRSEAKTLHDEILKVLGTRK